MYVELFLLDNLLMNLLIVRLAAALLQVSPPLMRQTAAALLAAGYAAAAAYLRPVMGSLWLRPLPLVLLSLGLPFRGPRGFFACLAALLPATFCVGGAAVCAALLTGGRAGDGFISAGIPLRAALAGAAAASFLPRAARRLAAKRGGGSFARLSITQAGITRTFRAFIDTGNRLSEPLTGLPVAVVGCRALGRYADIPISVRTAAGRGTLMAFRPDSVSVNGLPAACLVAVSSAGLEHEAVIPPALVPRSK